MFQPTPVLQESYRTAPATRTTAIAPWPQSTRRSTPTGARSGANGWLVGLTHALPPFTRTSDGSCTLYPRQDGHRRKTGPAVRFRPQEHN